MEFYSLGSLICGEATSENGEGGLFKGETWSQYTGLKDIHGNEIYEGDFLKETAPRGNKYRVISVPGGFAINMFQDEIREIVHFESLADMQNNSYVQSNCEIIGNIFSHPQLLTP